MEKYNSFNSNLNTLNRKEEKQFLKQLNKQKEEQRKPIPSKRIFVGMKKIPNIKINKNAKKKNRVLKGFEEQRTLHTRNILLNPKSRGGRNRIKFKI